MDDYGGREGGKQSGCEAEIRHETWREGVYSEVGGRAHCSFALFSLA